ncbi:MAG: DUF3641 domain-containing protein [Opitutaceae bacterium]|nr:DUF3641 domain-containing protein [Opitutaceae bacterium]
MLLQTNARNAPRYLGDIEPEALENEPIATGDHCFGCTAGAGSSCGGAIETAVADTKQA